MEWLLLFIGILLVMGAYTDLLQTTIQHTGAGFYSLRAGSYIWRIFLRLSGNDGRKSFLGLAGLTIVSILIISWIISIWLGFTLIFNFQPDSVLYTDSDQTTNFMDKLYYAGYTLSTLGNGDLKPSNNLWRILTVLISISGLLIITLSITYLLPLLSAVTNKRKLCAYISFLGSSPEEIILKGWNGKDLSNLNQHFYQLSLMVLDHKEKHLLYPVLHYFHSTDKNYAAPLALAVLDETISLIMASPELSEKTDMVTIKLLRSSFDEYLGLLNENYIQSRPTAPAYPAMKPLEMEIDLSTNQIREYMETESERRRLLHGMVMADGWGWPLSDDK